MIAFIAAVRGWSIASGKYLVTAWPVGEVLEKFFAAPNTMRKAVEERGFVSDRIRLWPWDALRRACRSVRLDREAAEGF